jgi:hypothetical protein
MPVAVATIMSRYAVLLVVVIGCGPGDITGGVGNENDSPDGGVVGGGPDGAAVACVPAVTGLGSGVHNAGQACIACHLGNGGPDFTLAGTLSVPGGTITVTDADGLVVEVVSQNNGNFYTSTALTFPVQVSASRCPDTAPMISAVAQGDCNSAGCHAAGSATGPIHLP